MFFAERSGRHRGGTAFGRQLRQGCLAALISLGCPLFASAQVDLDVQSPAGLTPLSSAAPSEVPTQTEVPSLRAWEGLRIVAVRFSGVEEGVLDPLPGLLELQPGMPLAGDKLRESLRRLYATGLYRTISVEGTRAGNEVTIIFTGEPRVFIGRVSVTGVKSDRIAAQLVRAAKLDAGTVYSEMRLARGIELMRAFLTEIGYYVPTVASSTQLDAGHSLMNVTYRVTLGPNARVGAVVVDGNSEMTPAEFRKKARLKAQSKVTRDTSNRALNGLRKAYQKQQRLESEVDLKSKEYKAQSNHLDFLFGVDRGPVVTIEVVGAKLNKTLIKRLIPVYEEGATDDDLLNEGDRNLRDYYQRAGYFNAKITHQTKVRTAELADIVYTVDLGAKHRVLNVSVKGNKYFSNETIEDRLTVIKADVFQRSGLYSQALVNSDVTSITALYQSNGFNEVKVTPTVSDSDLTPEGKPEKISSIAVQYVIEEGRQQKIGKFEILGAKQVPLATLQPLLNTVVEQPYSASNVSGDRDTILGYYLDHGFGQAQVNVVQQTDAANSGLVDVTINITEGDEIFVRKVLVSGIEHTRPKTVNQLLTIHPGDPLNQAALLDTQRRLYNLALFNEVTTAVQNPTGAELQKNVLIQLTEAKRWDFNYGFGFEAQTGNPSASCLSRQTLISIGIDPNTYHCSPNGKTGVSPAVIFDVTRTNLRGTNQSITLRTAYGNLEQRATVTYQVPHLLGLQTFNGSLAGGYINAQDVTTYASSRLEGSLRVTERADRRNTFIYEFSYRRVKVNNIQVSPNLVPLYSQPVRVGGPGVTWVRDTRDSPLDAHHGTYNTIQEFFADGSFGSQSNFNRVDMTNSSYYSIGKKNWVIARSTRFGMEHAFGSSDEQIIPLPEKLYAGGAQSHRGFGINQAGPRDEQTGFPIGGQAVFVNTVELRLPYPTLPYVGNSLGFVLFHDMGNAFNQLSDVAPSFLRFHQPNVATCKDISVVPPQSAVLTSGNCSFNYFSHALGLGLRYRTPIGPIRGDFAVNLDPPYYPVFVRYSSNSSNPVTTNPYVGNSGHFNFFFSIGQSF